MLSKQTRQQAREVVARYPRPRSALLPLLHLVQSDEGYVSPEGISLCAEVLELTKAEVGAVATFYTMYKRRPVGEYHVGVCTNTLCAVMGGDVILDRLQEHLGITTQNGVTDDGKVSLEHVECNAACDYAPVVMVNWEFFDNQTPSSAVELVDALRGGAPVTPTRGASSVCTWREAERVLAGFPDGRADEGAGAGPATLEGLRLARAQGDDRGAGGNGHGAGGDVPGAGGDVPGAGANVPGAGGDVPGAGGDVPGAAGNGADAAGDGAGDGTGAAREGGAA